MELHGRIPGRAGYWRIRLEGQRVAAVEPVPAEGSDALWISPGFVDLQVNGYAGVDLNGEGLTDEAVAAMVQALWPTGAVLIFPTLVTGPFERLARAARTLAGFIESGPHAGPAARRAAASLAGIHLEGPYISPEDGPRGAHDRRFVRPPDWEEFCCLQEVAGGHIRLVTLAPELPGALPFIEKAVASGVTVAIGHTGAPTETIQAAVGAGARLSTHLGNGAHAVLRRHPNYIWDQLAADELYASFIADGFHLPAAVLKSFVRAKGVHRSILVTDAVAVAGQPPGVYRTLGMEVEVTPEGRVRLRGTDFLAGSGLRLDEAVNQAMALAGVSLAEAVAMVTENPARLMGLEGRTGWLRAGMEANLTLFRLGPGGRVDVVAAVVRGETVYREV